MSYDEPQTGMATATKVIIGLVAAGCICLALCCGGAVWMVNRAIDATQEFVAEMADAMTQNPVEVRAMTDSMLTIEVPAGWQPVMGMQWSLGSEMTMATYSPNQMQANRTLMLMQMQGAGVNQQQMEQQMQMQMNQQGVNQAYGTQSSEIRTFVIDGEEREFLFTIIDDGAGTRMHQVQGVFPGRNGTIMLMFMEDDANWDEDVVEQMIESISTQATPQDRSQATPVDSTQATPQDSTQTTAEEIEPL